MAPRLSRQQGRFLAALYNNLRRDGQSFDPQFLKGWLIAENPAGAKSTPQHGNQNWLNIGNTDSRFYGQGGAYSNPGQAGKNTARWLRGEWSMPGFGRAAGGIVAFSRTAGRGRQAQIDALQRSGWASSGYPNLESIVAGAGRPGFMKYARAGASRRPRAGRRKVTVPGAPTLRLSERAVFDAEGYARAQREFALGQILRDRESSSSPFDVGPSPAGGARPSNTLLRILPEDAPDPLDFQDAVQSLEQIAGRPIRVDLGRSRRRRSGGARRRGRAVVVPGADRDGVATHKRVTDFLGVVAGSVGRPIDITTGTNHSQYTTSGNVSDHWVGNGADIAVPDRSREGDMIAGRALLLAGVPRMKARAMAQQGGLFNIYPKSGPLRGMRLQVIWKTQEGGNHDNHVHVGIRPA